MKTFNLNNIKMGHHILMVERINDEPKRCALALLQKNDGKYKLVLKDGEIDLTEKSDFTLAKITGFSNYNWLMEFFG